MGTLMSRSITPGSWYLNVSEFFGDVFGFEDEIRLTHRVSVLKNTASNMPANTASQT